VDTLLHTLDEAAGLLVKMGCVLVGLMALHVVLDVTGRYVFNAPLPGTVEFVSHYYMVGVIFWPLAYVQSQRGHFVAEVFTQRMPPMVVRGIDATCTLVTALLLAFLTWRTAAYALEFTQARESVQTAYFTIATWPSRWFVPLGLGLMALYALVQALQAFFGRGASGAGR
jgi:TRAP-type C4-dicarboxylate transport system permease small subunit